MANNANGHASGKTRQITQLAILTAIVVVLQLLGSFIKFGGFSISLVLVPIVVGSATCGVIAGGWLGLVFGVTVLLSGDAALFLTFNPAATVLVVLLKGVAAGLVSGLVYHWIESKSKVIATAAAAIVCPVVNTGIFVIGCYLFFLEGIAQSFEFNGSITAFIFTAFIGGNFIVELLINMILSPAIVRIIDIGKRIQR